MVLYFLSVLQLVIDAAFGWIFYKRVCDGHGDSVSGFLSSTGVNWNVCNSNSGVIFPKEKVFAEWLWGWLSANDISIQADEVCELVSSGGFFTQQGLLFDADFEPVSSKLRVIHSIKGLQGFSVTVAQQTIEGERRQTGACLPADGDLKRELLCRCPSAVAFDRTG